VGVLLIRAGLDAESDPGRTVPTATRPARTATEPTTTARRPQPPRRTYTIQEGDTLDQVALDHDTTVERLLELNPRIDPTSLQVGQRLVVPG
jgi:LysM repeat protein